MMLFSSPVAQTYQGGWAVLTNWVDSKAMGILQDLALETKFHELQDGQRTSVLAEVLIFHPGKHLCRSAMYRQLFQTDVELNHDSTTFTILDADYHDCKGNAQLIANQSTAVIQHAQDDASSFTKIIEACAGIGGVGQGFAYAGVETVCFAELNMKFCEWLKAKHDQVPIVQGDIYLNDTIKKVADAAKGKAMLSAGFSCQPFSGLGDRRQGEDPRSRSLLGALRMGYLLRCPLILLECTKEVMSSDWAQSVFRIFCEVSGYAFQQQIVELHNVLPSLRTRWWGVLALPTVGTTDIPQLPKLSFQPCISDLFQLHHELPAEELDQLILDTYEARHFHNSRGGIGPFMVNRSRQMQTATHSLGTQLSACHCGCRSSGFSASRIQEKGLYGILVPMEKMMESPYNDWFLLRHPHPCEIAIVNGLLPTYLKTTETFSLKFFLGGVGQMASPVQGLWVLSNALKQIHEKTGIVPEIDPLRLLANLCVDLIESRFEVWSNQVTNEYTDRYLHEFLNMRSIPPATSGTDIFAAAGSVKSDAPSTELPIEHALGTFCTDRSHFACAPTEPATAFEPATSPTTDVGPIPNPVPGHVVSEATTLDLSDASAIGQQCRTKAPDSRSHFAAGVPNQVTDHASFAIAGESKSAHEITTVTFQDPCTDVASHHFVPGFLHTRQPENTDSGPPIKRTKRTDPKTFSPTSIHEPYDAKGGMNLFANTDAFPNTVNHKDNTSSATITTDIIPHDQISASQPGIEDDFLTDKHEEHPGSATAAIAPDHLPPLDEGVEPTVEPTATWPALPATPDSTDVIHEMQISAYADEIEEPIIVWIGIEREPLYAVRCSPLATVGQVIQAEAALCHMPVFVKPLTAVGSDLSFSDTVQSCQIILIRLIDEDNDSRCPQQTQHTGPPQVEGLLRTDALWNQRGWVAWDEMTFYMNSIHTACQTSTTAPIQLYNNPGDSSILGKWIVEACQIAAKPGHSAKIATACFLNQHWFPIVCEFTEAQVDVTIPCDVQHVVEFNLAAAFQSDEFPTSIGLIRTCVLPKIFANDCGFQTVAYILKELRGDQDFPMPAQEAIEWRVLFAQHLLNFLLHKQRVTTLLLGGAIDHGRAELCQLLEAHGVQPKRSSAAAQHVITTLGATTVSSILKSPKPWRDLKSRANQCQPPIQLVLADELQAQIEKRQKEGKSVGSKQTKAKHTKSKLNQAPDLTLKPDQIKMPEGIWKQHDNTTLKQITAHQVQQRQKGIALMTIEEAQPYLQLKEAICTEGLAILILNSHGVTMPEACQQVSFPASYVATQEPMIITAHIVQLGQQAVQRVMPSNPITVNEVPTEVLRCVIHRDQFNQDWSMIVKQPVRTLMELEHLKTIQTNQILDVWDRQYLTKTFQKARPDQADQFSVILRLTQEGAQIALGANGHHGIYVEPRAPHGKSPHEGYKVVWLPRKDYNEAVIAQQTTKQQTAIVRSGDRYGLRTATSHAQEVHNQHRPEVSYLDSSKLKQYKLAPLPFGTTKANLQQVCAEWEWAARPNHSIGLTGDQQGLAWIVQATEPPKYWMWTMTHGDVLIQEITQTRSQQAPPSRSIVASHRTLQHITYANGAHQGAPVSSSQDPWANYDPWKKPSVSSNTGAMSNAQVAQIEATLTKRIDSAIQSRVAETSVEDADMTQESESRVSQLEKQVHHLTDGLQKLSANVGQFQQAQQLQNQQMTQQTQALQSQVEQQSHQMQKVLDTAMEDQMRRIEALFSKDREHAAKVARTGEWLAFCQPMHVIPTKLMRAILLAFIIIRIGEASNPGPAKVEHEVSPPAPGLTIGAINPTGILKKSHAFSEIPQKANTIWGISETHLTSPGIKKFSKELHCANPHLKFHPSAPTPFRSLAPTAITGTHQGTGFVTNLPCRRLQAQWTEQDWNTARFCMNTFLCESTWIHGATIYGIATQPETQRIKKITDDLLSLATTRIVTSMTGCRFICGDFNQEHDLPQVELWKSLGWKEVQNIYAERTQSPIRATCKGKTRKDYIWISPELQPFLSHVEVIPHIFPDHSVLSAHFHPLGEAAKIYHWHKPLPLPWDDLKNHLSDKPFSFNIDQSTDEQCRAIGVELENRFQQQYQTDQNRQLLPCHKGRCQTTKTIALQPHSKPIKPSRHGDYQPEFHGMSMQHQRWFTQLRRVQSLNRLYTKEVWTLTQDIHAHREWRAICTAAGFVPGFPQWWAALPATHEFAPKTLPTRLPTSQELQGILITLEGEVRAFERELQKTFQQRAKHNRAVNPNQIFRDFSKPFASPIQLLDHSKVATVVEVNPDECSMILDCTPDFKHGQIAGPNGLFTPIITCEDTVWTHPVDLAQPGDILRQENLIGHVDDLFAQFSKEWSQRWDRHKSLPHDHWQELIQFFQNTVPKQQTFELPPISYEDWVRAVKKKKTRAATGPDGLSKTDLLRMPKPITIAMLKLFEQIEQHQVPWPEQWMHGHVHLLEKTPGASKASQYRPITLFALPYRVWSSIRTTQVLHRLLDSIPSQCYGSIPGRSANHMWLELQYQIETALDQNFPLAGGVADIQKCFNHLPRVPTLAVLIHLGMPHHVVRAWAKGLNQMTRHFKIRQSIGPGIRSSTGFAEGCPLSIVAMIGINVMVDLWVRLREPRCQFWSYIDNHEVTAVSAQAAQKGFEALETILSILDLPVDKSKSYVWATTPQDRKQLAQIDAQLVRSCRDLGGQMQYTRVCNNFVITARIDAFKCRWKDLANSPAPYAQKLRALRTVAWTNVLHGIPSAHLGPKHYEGLRTHALRALQEHGAGVSPLAHLSLVESPEFDPEFYAIITTVMHTRNILTIDQVAPILHSLTTQAPRKRPRPGPCSVLLERLKRVDWSWDLDGHFVDHVGAPIDIWNSPIQLLRKKLQEAWQHVVSHQLSHRKTFEGIQHTNARFTTANFPPQPRDAAVLRNALNGAFFTGDHLKQRDATASGNCRLCGEFEDIYHRHWTCPALASARTQLTNEQTATVLGMSPATYNHGWFPLPASVHAFNAALRSVPTPPMLERVNTDQVSHLHFFTDGACINPDDHQVRLCSWGVGVSANSDPWTVHPIGNGILQGECQTIARAELFAALEALTAAWEHQCPFSIWCDSQIVVNKLRYMQATPSHSWSCRTKNHDLLNAIASLMRQVGPLLCHVSKVCSHQADTAAHDEVEAWCFRSNDCADSIASQAFANNPAIFHLLNQATKDLAAARALRDAFHRQLINIGLMSLTKIQKLDGTETTRAPGPAPPPVQMEPWNLDMGTACPSNYAIATYPALLEWNRSLHDPEGITQVWSWWELYIDACFRIPAFAPTYDVKKLIWYNDDKSTAAFLKRTKSFARYMGKLSHLIQVELPCRIANPQSAIICFWTKCLPVQVALSRHEAIDTWLGRYLTGATKTADLSVVPWLQPRCVPGYNSVLRFGGEPYNKVSYVVDVRGQTSLQSHRLSAKSEKWCYFQCLL